MHYRDCFLSLFLDTFSHSIRARSVAAIIQRVHKTSLIFPKAKNYFLGKDPRLVLNMLGRLEGHLSSYLNVS